MEDLTARRVASDPFRSTPTVDVQVSDLATQGGRVKIQLSVSVIVSIEVHLLDLTESLRIFVEASLVRSPVLTWGHDRAALLRPHWMDEIVLAWGGAHFGIEASPGTSLLPEYVQVIEVEIWLAMRLRISDSDNIQIK